MFPVKNGKSSAEDYTLKIAPCLKTYDLSADSDFGSWVTGASKMLDGHSPQYESNLLQTNLKDSACPITDLRMTFYFKESAAKQSNVSPKFKGSVDGAACKYKIKNNAADKVITLGNAALTDFVLGVNSKTSEDMTAFLASAKKFVGPYSIFSAPTGKKVFKITKNGTSYILGMPNVIETTLDSKEKFTSNIVSVAY